MTELSKIERYLAELNEITENPIHKCLIASYKGDDPKQSMETELGKLLEEVIKRED
jgi:hypothetical protein